MRFNASNATCLIYTFKEGMLSAMAHDLKLRVERFEIVAEGLESGSPTQVTAHFETASIRVVCAMKDGTENPTALSESDRKKIEQTILEDVLPPKRAREVHFRSTRLEGDRIEGLLSLNGVERPLVVQARREAGRATVEVEVNQPDFSIKPYTAALGALRIRPRVRVLLSVPLPG
ncbi:MAG: YceI family protein [Myxococcales bacterium]|nr:YceI family protein [Polyangiaceae bacterium]MDW8249292.1 YceI family protein [Myxococcales bacterium]